MTDASICAEMQVAADSGESGDEAGGMDPAEVTEGGPTATFKDAVQSLRMLRGYLESSGCDDYDYYYKLCDQIHEINQKNSKQKQWLTIFVVRSDWSELISI